VYWLFLSADESRERVLAIVGIGAMPTGSDVRCRPGEDCKLCPKLGGQLGLQLFDFAGQVSSPEELTRMSCSA
jgi:hypothetical protein